MSDLISRAEVHKTLSLIATEGGTDAKMLLSDAHEFIDALPFAETHDKRTETHGVCSDLIRREDAIEAVRNEIQDFEKNYMHGEDDENFGHDIGFVAGLHRAKTFIRSLPSAEAVHEWIPVSDRLPEKDGRYLVTNPLLGDDLWVLTAWYGTPPMPSIPVKGKCFFVSDDEYGDVPYDDVVAWMPLPEPYKGGEDE